MNPMGMGGPAEAPVCDSNSVATAALADLVCRRYHTSPFSA